MRITFLVVMLSSLSASAADKVRVAMFPVRVEAGVAQGTANLLGEVIAADVARSDRHQLLTAADVQAVISNERQKQLTGCTEDTSCLAEIGNALGTEFILDVSVGTIGNLRVLALRLIDAKGVRATRRESESVMDESQLVSVCHRLTAKLFDLPLEPSKRGRVVPGFVVLGGAGALVIGGIVVGSLAKDDVAAYRADPFNEAFADRARTKAYVADGLYAGALLTAGVATFLLITGLSSPAETVEVK